MIDQELKTLLQRQVMTELSAAHTYLQLALYLEHASWEGIAAFFYRQAQEEREHAVTFARLLMERGHHVHLTGVSLSEGSVDLIDAEPCAAFRVALKLEQNNLAAIKTVYQKALDKNEHSIIEPLGALLAEQQKEVADVESKVDVLERIGGDNGALYLFDQGLHGE